MMHIIILLFRCCPYPVMFLFPCPLSHVVQPIESLCARPVVEIEDAGIDRAFDESAAAVEASGNCACKLQLCQLG